ncbi:hypothetical protein [Kaarinaea lacus]
MFYLNIVGFKVVVVVLISCFPILASARDQQPDYQWQLQRLMSPSAEDLQFETKGTVFIYDGIKSSDIDIALDVHHERMESMMFINTIWTDDKGQVLVDPYSGEVIADDDC